MSYLYTADSQTSPSICTAYIQVIHRLNLCVTCELSVCPLYVLSILSDSILYVTCEFADRGKPPATPLIDFKSRSLSLLN